MASAAGAVANGAVARLFTTNLESFPGTVFVTIGSLDRPELIQPMLEIFTKRRLKWTKPLDLKAQEILSPTQYALLH
jgi:hypothetical protein